LFFRFLCLGLQSHPISFTTTITNQSGRGHEKLTG
jgi:hypothetical protein